MEMAVKKGTTAAAKKESFGSQKGGHLVARFAISVRSTLRLPTLLESVAVAFDRQDLDAMRQSIQ